MKSWLVKTEPETYAFEDLVQKGEDVWDGVRNFQARNFLEKMNLGDQVFVYHSGKQREVVGLAEVSEEAFPDPLAKEDGNWVAVKLKPLEPLPTPVSLKAIKAESSLSDILLVKQSRLSVMPLDKKAAEKILKMSRV
jgi:predicted RNA-binding protein with PUA-like domain